MRSLFSAIALTICANSAFAGTVTFNVDPLPVAIFNPNDGIRQFNGTSIVNLNAFDVTKDTFAFDSKVLGIAGPVRFVNALAADLPNGLLNAIVLQDSDNDNNTATPFNAGAAANLIAGRVDIDGAGLFLYFNSVLNINRLVYARNLNDPTGDLAILAAIRSPVGADAIAALPTFTSASFTDVAPVPVPAALPMLAGGLLGLGWIRRKSSR